jgi:hypothetical protein
MDHNVKPVFCFNQNNGGQACILTLGSRPWAQALSRNQSSISSGINLSLVYQSIIGAAIDCYRRARQILIGWTPRQITFAGYQFIRRFPRLYFALRSVIMREFVGPKK